MPIESSDPFKGFVIEGRSDRRVYLEYGEENLDSSNYSINRKIYEQDAYDLWHLGVRYKELLNLRSINLADINLDQIPRQEKFLFLSILLLEYEKVHDLLELGSSVMEIVEGIKISNSYLNKYIKHNQNISNYKGIEISSLLEKASLDSHPNEKIFIYKSVNEYLKDTNSEISSDPKIMHDLGVASYAFSNSKDLAKFIEKFELCYMRMSLSLGDTFYSAHGGKSHTFFSVKDLLNNITHDAIAICNHDISKSIDSVWRRKSLGNPSLNLYIAFGKSSMIKNSFSKALNISEFNKKYSSRLILRPLKELINN